MIKFLSEKIKINHLQYHLQYTLGQEIFEGYESDPSEKVTRLKLLKEFNSNVAIIGVSL
jgi:hypothetical protein